VPPVDARAPAPPTPNQPPTGNREDRCRNRMTRPGSSPCDGAGRSRPCRLLPGPSGCRQSAPGIQAHQRVQSSNGTGPWVPTNTWEPGTRLLSGRNAVSGSFASCVINPRCCRSGIGKLTPTRTPTYPPCACSSADQRSRTTFPTRGAPRIIRHGINGRAGPGRAGHRAVPGAGPEPVPWGWTVVVFGSVPAVRPG